MATPQKERSPTLPPEAESTLGPIAKASSEWADRVRRAGALLPVVRGRSFAEASRRAGAPQ